MPAASREPSDLAQWMNRRLERANVPHRPTAEALIIWGSWHLNTAGLAWDLFQQAIRDGDENLTGHPMQTVELAAENLIFRGVVTAMDLCAAAIYRLTGQPLRADRERDVGWWFTNASHRQWRQVPAPQARWLRQFDHNETWELATEFRNAFTHRTLRRDITIVIGGPQRIIYWIGNVRYDPSDVMPTLIGYGKQRFSTFERSLAESYPMRRSRRP